MFKGKRFTIRSKIIAGYMIVVICLGFSIFALNSRINSLEKEIHFITDHDIEVHNLSNKIESTYLDMVARHRGYMISGNETYLNQYAQDKVEWQEEYRELYELVADNPSQQKNLDEIKASVEEWINTMGDPSIQLKIEGRTQDILSTYSANVGENVLNLLRSQTEDFRNTERELTEQRISELDESNTDLRMGLILIFILVGLISVLLAFFISGSIVKTIKQVIQAISDIASEEGKAQAKRIEVASHDELGDLGATTNSLLESYDRQSWLQTSISRIATANQGFTDIAELGEAVIKTVAHLLDAAYGVFYLRTGDRLVKKASFAAMEGDPGTASILMGEGLVGQCARDKRVFIVDPLQDSHVRIATALGESRPRSILIFPVEYEGKVQGVIELASLHTFTPLHQRLVELTSETVGIAINNVLSQMEVNRLLIESQALTEELQVQTEELEQSNLEVEKRSELLEGHMRKLEEINGQVEHQNTMLAKQAEDLKAASKYKSEFLANMSHELRTPLNSMLILSQLLADNKEGNLNPKQVEFAQTVHSSGSDLLRLIDDILDLSKVEAGHMTIEMSSVYLEEVKDNLWRSFEPLAAEKGIDYRVRLAGPLPETINTDGHRLQQILKNLLSNAFKFTTQGKIELLIYRPDNNPSAIAFAVKDTGIGIATDKMDIVFEAFQQADGSTSRKYGGTGLGLTISRELAVLIGGYIEIESKEGEGSTFTLVVPEYEQKLFEPAYAHTAASFEDYVSGTKVDRTSAGEFLRPRIEWNDPDLLNDPEVEDDRYELKPGDRTLLIIEDDLHFAKALLEMARARHFKGLVALQGDKGLALAHAYKPDAIILDIQLPVIDGWSVLEHLKQQQELRHIPVHIISVIDEQQQGLTMGAMAYLQKPVDKQSVEDVLSRIESFMDRDHKRLLIVEDDIVLQGSMVKLIGHNDVVITAVSTGEEALHELQKEHFDCMVLDLGLADISSFELLNRIRGEEYLKNLPIIIYTGRDLDMKEEMELKRYAESITIKNVKSQERLFAETALFLHRVEADLPEDRRNILKKLYTNEVAFDGKRILLVEDDIRNTFALTNVLESNNLQVSFAENGREAIELLEQDNHYDLILMDIMMPEMDGYEATRIIRSMPGYERIPVIALTAKAMKEDRKRCLEAGASDYISKPIDVEKLLSLLRVWLYA